MSEAEERGKPDYNKEVNRAVVDAIQKAKAKNDRLRLMKERNEIYTAERDTEMGEDEL